jgi:hypothetical protein
MTAISQNTTRLSRLCPTRFTVLFPMVCMQVFLTFTVFLFAFGPWPWPVTDPTLLYSYIFLGQFALWAGFTSAISDIPTKYTGTWKWEQLFKLSLVVNLVWIFPLFLMRLDLTLFDWHLISERVIAGWTEPGDAYARKLSKMASREGSSVLPFLTLFVSPLLQFLIPLGITDWRKLSLRNKILLFLIILAEAASWIGAGTNKGIADLFIFLVFFSFVAQPNFIVRLSFWRATFSLAVLFIGLYAFLTLFSSVVSSRLESNSSLLTYDRATGISADLSNPLLEPLPDEMRAGAATFASYLSQGYYGLSLSLDEPFVWTFGLGHGIYLPSLARKIYPDSDLAERSYPGRVAQATQWAYSINWHSIYPWLASDLTFVGALVAMYLLGRLFSLLWQDYLWDKNPIAITLLSLVLLIFFYIPANNQVFGFAIPNAAFWVLFIWWKKTRVCYTLPASRAPSTSVYESIEE